MAGRRKVKRRRKGWGGLYVLLTVVLTLAAVIIGLGLFFRVSQIEVSGAGAYEPEEIIKTSGIAVGDNMLMLDSAGASDRICSKLVYVESADIRKTFPNKIVIAVKENTPIATVSVSGQKWLIDSGCKALELAGASGSGLCEITGTGVENVEEGKVLETSGGKTQLKCLQELLGALEENGISGKIESIDISNIASIAFDFDGRFQVNLGAEGEIADKVTMLVGAVDKLEANAKGRLEFTTDVELHFIPD